MAHSKSAKKRVRQNVKCRARNRWRKEKVKAVVRTFEETVKMGNKDEAAKSLRAAFSALDRVAATGTIHKNAASRKKSRLAKRLSKLSKTA